MVDVGSPMLLSPSIPHACICTTYIYTIYIIYIYRERDLTLASKICIGHCKSCLPRYTMNPIVFLNWDRSFIETKWSLLAFWSSSIGGLCLHAHLSDIVCHFAVRACLECEPHVQSEKGLVVLIWPAAYSSRPGSHPFFAGYLFPDQCWRLPQHYGRQNGCRRHPRLFTVPAGAVLPRNKRNFHGSALNVSNQIWPLPVQSTSQSLWRFQYQPSSGPSETAIFEEELTRRWAEDNRLLACVPHCHVSWIYIYIFNLCIYLLIDWLMTYILQLHACIIAHTFDRSLSRMAQNSEQAIILI